MNAGNGNGIGPEKVGEDPPISEGATVRSVVERLRTARSTLKFHKGVAEGMTKHAAETKDPNHLAAAEEKDAVVGKCEEEVARLEAEAREANAKWIANIYFDGKRYWVPGDDENGGVCWLEENVGSLERQLRVKGWDAKRIAGGYSAIDQTIASIHTKPQRVSVIERLAGHKAGVVEMVQRKTLITESPRLIEPIKGAFPTVKEFIERLTQKEEEKYLWAWCHLAIVPMYTGELTPGQLLALAGPVNSGKSAFQVSIITPMMGGRVGKPYQFMSGQTSFNADLYEAEHLMLEDDISAQDMKARRAFGARLKQFTVNELSHHHGKGEKGRMLSPYWRMSMSLNDQPEDLEILLPIDKGLEDKITLLKTNEGAVPSLVERMGGKEAFKTKLKADMPAFLYHMIYEYEVPEEIRERKGEFRMGVRGYQNPELTKELNGTAPEYQLLEALQDLRDGPIGKGKLTSPSPP
jgi:hypothetical protein